MSVILFLCWNHICGPRNAGSASRNKKAGSSRPGLNQVRWKKWLFKRDGGEIRLYLFVLFCAFTVQNQPTVHVKVSPISDKSGATDVFTTEFGNDTVGRPFRLGGANNGMTRGSGFLEPWGRKKLHICDRKHKSNEVSEAHSRPKNTRWPQSLDSTLHTFLLFIGQSRLPTYCTVYHQIW